MEFQTPIKEDSMVFKAISDLKILLNDGMNHSKNDFIRKICAIQLNECEKVLDLIKEHRERYEAQQELDEQLQKQAYAFRFGSPIE